MSKPMAAVGERRVQCSCLIQRSTGNRRLLPNPPGVIVRRRMVTERSVTSTGTRKSVEMFTIQTNLTPTLSSAGKKDFLGAKATLQMSIFFTIRQLLVSLSLIFLRILCPSICQLQACVTLQARLSVHLSVSHKLDSTGEEILRAKVRPHKFAYWILFRQPKFVLSSEFISL